MMSVILDFLKGRWWLATLVATVLSVAGIIGVQHVEIVHLRQREAVIAAENLTVNNANRALAASVESQNRMIESIQALALAREKKAAARMAQAARTADAYRLRAAAVEATKPSRDECGDMRRLVDAFLRNALQPSSSPRKY